jgi:CheY-like chemotaxis protein
MTMTTPAGRNGSVVPAGDAGLSSTFPPSLLRALERARAHAQDLSLLALQMRGDDLDALHAEMRFAQEIPRLIAGIMAEHPDWYGLLWCRLLAKIHAYGLEALALEASMTGDARDAIQRAGAQAWDVSKALDAVVSELREGGAA